MGFVQEFKAFAMRGNVIDMAVGIIIGAAFGRVVSSLVSNVLMPPIGLLLGGVDFSNLKITLKAATMDAHGKAVPEVALGYGLFINTIIEFLIVSFAIFMVIKVINAAKKKPAAAEAPPSRQEELLAEIRDLLKSKPG